MSVHPGLYVHEPSSFDSPPLAAAELKLVAGSIIPLFAVFPP